ncbi:MAG: hypothetical protein IJV71_03775, partial [Lachnospiraceae bacterium]|nr:hypothetical protein [Lachnospiraceae bacterium]
MDDKEMNVISDVYSEEIEKNKGKKSLNKIGPEDQRVENTGNFFLGIATGVVCTLVVIILGIVVGTLISKKYINTDDKNQLMENAGLNDNVNNQKELLEIMSKMQYIQQVMDTYYYYDIDMDDIADNVYQGMLEALGDPYSVYYDEEAFAALMESTTGTYCGIGVVVSQNIE